MGEVDIARRLNREYRIPFGLALRMARHARNEAEAGRTNPWPDPPPRYVIDHMDEARRLAKL